MTTIVCAGGSDNDGLPFRSRAVVLAAGQPTRLGVVSGHECMPLCPLVDKPFLQHVVECLVTRGFTEIDFVICQQADQMEALLGTGQRWGATFRFHLARDPSCPYAALARLSTSSTDTTEENETAKSVLLIDAKRLDPDCWLTETTNATGRTLFVCGRR